MIMQAGHGIGYLRLLTDEELFWSIGVYFLASQLAAVRDNVYLEYRITLWLFILKRRLKWPIHFLIMLPG